MPKPKVAVIGAGVMGSGVALTLSAYGYEVILKDIRQEALCEARQNIEGQVRMVKMMRRDLREISAEGILQNITFSLDYQGFGTVGIVVENVAEKWETKAAVYQELKAVCPPETIYCVNTSCISITKVASLMNHPEKVVGMHFMNPVPLKEMVEVIKGHHTDEETLEQARLFLKSIKKSQVVVNDFPGFVANRLSHLFMNEAAFLIQDQVASPKDIDLLFKKGYGHTMGPLETADLIGLDTVVDSLEVLYQDYQDSKFRCCPLLKKMVNAGLLGKKSGQGFYTY